MAVSIDMEFAKLLHNIISFTYFISDQCAGAHYFLWKFPNFASASNMIMSWHGNVFPIIGHLWWGSTGQWWIPLTKSHIFWATYWMNGQSKCWFLRYHDAQLLSFQSEICLGYVARKGQNDNKNELYMTKNNVAFQTKLYNDHEYDVNFTEFNIGIVANPCFLSWGDTLILSYHSMIFVIWQLVICHIAACNIAILQHVICHITRCFLLYYSMLFAISYHSLSYYSKLSLLLQHVILHLKIMILYRLEIFCYVLFLEEQQKFLTHSALLTSKCVREPVHHRFK